METVLDRKPRVRLRDLRRVVQNRLHLRVDCFDAHKDPPRAYDTPMRRLLIVLLLLTLGTGCQAPVPNPISNTAPAPLGPPPPPVLIHLPGIGGEMAIDRRLMRGLLAGEVAKEGEILDWTGADRGLNALGHVERNRQQAKDLADRIVEIHRRDARTRIILSAHSGGTGIVVWALEQLPPDVKIDRLLMLASALSPTYDLSRALAHVQTGAYSFHSEYDTIVLKYGTMALGTIDRQQVPAAGYEGFAMPEGADRTQYAKLHQYAYDPAWMRLGNDGQHIGATHPVFAEQILAPLLRNVDDSENDARK